jgi:glyoxylase-like metal-dependent hydrolase (beta-lactamase superfamily II)
MRINDRVVLAGSGLLGFHTSNDLDCNLYLLDAGSECALIDAGSGRDPARIVANIEAAGVDPSCVRTVLLTHAHGDHAAGARYFHDNFDAQVMCAGEAAPWVENAEVERVSLPQAQEAGIYPADFEFPSCPITRRLNDGDLVRVGEIELKVLETPGHSRGHLSYLWNDGACSALFGGDVVFAGGKIVLQNTWDCSIQDYAATMARLHDLHLDRLYPGHGVFLLSEAYVDIERAHDKFSKLGLPGNLV